MQLLEDEMERKITTQKNDLKILAITRKDLIAKEACYHFTCYKLHTSKQSQGGQCTRQTWTRRNRTFQHIGDH